MSKEEPPHWNPSHHPTRWYKYFLIRCYDCQWVAPARVATWGPTMFKCVQCGGTIYDEDFGEDGYREVPAEIAEEWDYSEELRATLKEDSLLLAQLEGIRERAQARGELPHLNGGQLRLWSDD